MQSLLRIEWVMNVNTDKKERGVLMNEWFRDSRKKTEGFILVSWLFFPAYLLDQRSSIGQYSLPAIQIFSFFPLKEEM